MGALSETEPDRLGRLARALAGDTDGAAALLAAARVAADRRPRRRPAGDAAGLVVDPAEERAAARRAALVRAFLRGPRRPSAPAPAAGPATEPDLTPAGGPGPAAEGDPDLDAVRRRLDGLAPLPRAVLVLREVEGLTLADVVRLTERSGPSVTRALATATDAVGAPGHQLERVVAAVEPPTGGQVETARRGLEARRRRVRGRWLLAGVLVVALVAAATVLPGVLRPDPYARAAGTWVYGYDLRPDAEVRVLNRFLTPGRDTAELVDRAAVRGGAVARTCDVTATSSTEPAPTPEGRATRVGTRPGRFLAADSSRGAGLWWRDGPRTVFELSCSPEGTDAELLAVAAAVVPAEVPVLLPVDLRALPAGEEVHGLYDLDGQVAVLVLPPGETEESPNALYVSVGSSIGGTPRPGGRTVRVGDATARVEEDAESVAVCWDLGGPQACVADFNGDAGSAPARQRRLARLLGVARAVRVASGPTDRSTWFDARAAVPG
ncbi:hypothetical protein ACFFOM_19360 [Microlunatus capsulatus]|uniref:DNA-directed RNA polymerase specialized sigma24 family protein n=1 Tax=Microlunatus capsulatus TaxID=99117 RepID=A0ABS4ZCY9_9ACTN|nr:hypothetical protein [Microlunatus capsulatus]MBP2418829.1 DNA-directed RNA polymerase specialized sigma24 family protein [Microlunatus capsulatus]